VTIAVILPSAFYLKICWDEMSKFKRVANLGCLLGVLGSFDSSKSLVKELVRVHGANPPLGPPPVSAGDLETRPEENREGSGDLDIPVAMHAMAQQIGTENGVEVKVHVIEEGNEADDYTWILVKDIDNTYFLKRGWGPFARANNYQEGDVIGLMWDQSYERFLLHKIVQY
ncbi:unnamed protein product, partial [Microthlaspi erraticum]